MHLSDVELSISVISVMKLKNYNEKNTKRFGSAFCLVHLLLFFTYWQNVRQYFNLTSHRELCNRKDTLYQCPSYLFIFTLFSVLLILPFS